MKQLTDK